MINTIGGMKQVLETYNAQDWLKSSKVSESKNNQADFNISDISYGEKPHNNLFKPVDQKTFGDFLFESISKVNELQNNANVAMEKLATGQNNNIHETMLIVEQAELAFKTMNQIRMKVLDAYKEIMKIQI